MAIRTGADEGVQETRVYCVCAIEKSGDAPPAPAGPATRSSRGAQPRACNDRPSIATRHEHSDRFGLLPGRGDGASIGARPALGERAAPPRRLLVRRQLMLLHKRRQNRQRLPRGVARRRRVRRGVQRGRVRVRRDGASTTPTSATRRPTATTTAGRWRRPRRGRRARRGRADPVAPHKTTINFPYSGLGGHNFAATPTGRRGRGATPSTTPTCAGSRTACPSRAQRAARRRGGEGEEEERRGEREQAEAAGAGRDGGRPREGARAQPVHAGLGAQVKGIKIVLLPINGDCDLLISFSEKKPTRDGDVGDRGRRREAVHPRALEPVLLPRHC